MKKSDRGLVVLLRGKIGSETASCLISSCEGDKIVIFLEGDEGKRFECTNSGERISIQNGKSIICPDIPKFCKAKSVRCPNDCSLNGYCLVNNKCMCYSGYSGKDCSIGGVGITTFDIVMFFAVLCCCIIAAAFLGVGCYFLVKNLTSDGGGRHGRVRKNLKPEKGDNYNENGVNGHPYNIYPVGTDNYLNGYNGGQEMRNYGDVGFNPGRNKLPTLSRNRVINNSGNRRGFY